MEATNFQKLFKLSAPFPFRFLFPLPLPLPLSLPLPLPLSLPLPLPLKLPLPLPLHFYSIINCFFNINNLKKKQYWFDFEKYSN